MGTLTRFTSKAAALAAILAAALGEACAGAPAPRAAGNDGWLDPSSPAPPAPTAARPRERWELDAQLKLLRPAVKRLRTGHLTGDLEGEILAAGAGTYPRLGPDSRLPPGATLVERLHDAGSAVPLAYFVMIKRQPGFDPTGSDWEYLVVAPSGEIEQRGALPLCARCHAEAPHDRLFGAPR